MCYICRMITKHYNYVYKVTNIIDGKFYIGKHSTNKLHDNYMGSGIKLKRAMREYGEEYFIKEILMHFDTAKEASDYEKELVTMELVRNQMCYNNCIGGSGN